MKGATVCPDAMGCQKKIAREMQFAGGDYLLALKGNHGVLHEEMMELFTDEQALEYGQFKGAKVTRHDLGAEKSHDRFEQRVVRATDYLKWFEPVERKHWLGLRSFVEITTRTKSRKKRPWKSATTSPVTYRKPANWETWGVPIGESKTAATGFLMSPSLKTNAGHAVENLALLRKLTLNLLRHDKTIKDTMRGKRIRAALFEKFFKALFKLESPK